MKTFDRYSNGEKRNLSDLAYYGQKPERVKERPVAKPKQTKPSGKRGAQLAKRMAQAQQRWSWK